MKIRLAAPCTHDSIVDGSGVRMVVWTQGCLLNCPGCHNKQTHDIDGGYWAEVEDIIQEYRKSCRLHSGITISGGEPFLQARACLELAKGIKSLGKSVWIYTGYTIEKILAEGKEDCLNLLHQVDVVVDGPFLINKKHLDLPYRGSSNQRMIEKSDIFSFLNTL